MRDKYTDKGQIQVWTDMKGNRYAAQQLEPRKIGFYRTNLKAKQEVTLHGTAHHDSRIAANVIEATVYVITKELYNRQGLIEEELAELKAAAETQQSPDV